ncbi:hypothetical protein [Sagittula stellata]|uniref:Uncharacterized protein n=1 Tax=Sagittula stellata (strain ATCC 700073 / DSM 11524 / E-37) TaxID=388399 RepID=A3K167_SAGS3|nr:hypothetical protein [Sagittula stellata]EBA09532.1 hypothetical protein SSE37_24859 [Sagittula stellata E-37]
MISRTTKFARTAFFAVLAVATLAGTGSAQAQQAREYCWTNSDKVNVLAGDFSNGFYAYPLGRSGNSLYYERVGNTNRYVGTTGAIYTLFSDGRATWSDGSQMIKLYYCR